MSYYLETVDTIEPGLGFELYGMCHLIWLIFGVVMVASVSKMYRGASSEKRIKMRRIVGGLLVADELFKICTLVAGGNYSVDYLPLHLCSINIIFIAIHCIKSNKLLDNFLYIACIPGAITALLFPTWTSLPFGNLMHMHSFTVHILLIMYPVMLTVGGDIRPEVKMVPKCLAFLLIMAVPIGIFNMIFDTNFMFLMEAPAGSPLYWFAENWGNHLLGYPSK